MTAKEKYIFDAILSEIGKAVVPLAKLHPPETRGDYLRLIRVAVELLPARPPV
jgi:hypothetical protein